MNPLFRASRNAHVPSFLWRMASCLILASQSFGQVTLQPWMEVYGAVGDAELGKLVRGIPPTSNFPFRMVVFNNDTVGIYNLETPQDSLPDLIFPGHDVLTGDLNDDGYTDLVISRRIGSDWDTIDVFWGTSAGIDTVNPFLIPGNEKDGLFQAAVIADVNNDQFVDLVTQQPNHDVLRGRVAIYLGPNITTEPDISIFGDSVLSRFGGAVVVGDLNDDSLNDLIIRGWHNAGPSQEWYDYTNIYWGAGFDTLDLTLDVQLRGYPYTSTSLSSFDANGDSVDDLLWHDYIGQNWVNVHYGRPVFDTIPDLRLDGSGIGNFGELVINAGDMNGDGYNDILVAAPSATITSGFVFVFGGGPDIDTDYDAAVGQSQDSDFGRSVTSVGDVNGDGLADLVVGAPDFPFVQRKGYFGIFLGDSAIVVTDVSLPDIQLPHQFTLHQNYPNPFNSVTIIRYDLHIRARAILEVYDALGRVVVTLHDGTQDPGSYEAVLDGSMLASGVYYYSLTTRALEGEPKTESRGFLLIK